MKILANQLGKLTGLCNLPIPLDDELINGLVGRIARLNGLSTSQAVLQALGGEFQIPGRGSPLQLVSMFLNFDERTLAKQHSMLPVLNPISGRVAALGEGDGCRSKTKTYTKRRLPVNSLRWCPKCACLDRAARGFSYWRRQHHLIGVDWCVVHREPLLKAPLSADIDAPGHELIEAGAEHMLDAIGDEALHPVVQRFEQLMVGWLLQPAPTDHAVWSAVVRTECQKAGLRICEVGQRSIASDLIRDLFPNSWLNRYMPDVTIKSPQVCVRKVDGACIDKHVVYPTLVCTALMAVLFSSSEEAFRALKQGTRQFKNKERASQQESHALDAFLTGQRLHESFAKFGVDALSAEDAIRKLLKRRSVSSISFK
ncbi:TniQ family protein [Comamonas sp. C11]|uniref:TniQ family protein n=1 Tax=Comamonas sp. C11 TaxID=2966554 RepID=UPI0021131E04|nr:TniQ family protein [Comamonas sp. C11]UUC94382.1 TniQ family protein [Comamonas sp. C11]